MTARRVFERATGPVRQRGFAMVIMVTLLLALVSYMVVEALNMAGSDTYDTAVQNDAVEALFLAESAIERAVNRYTSGTTCDGALVETVTNPFGGGADTRFAVLGVPAAPDPLIVAGRCRLRVQGTVGNAQRTVQVEFTGGGTGIAFDRSRNDRINNDTSMQWNHQVNAAGVNRVLIVGVSIKNAQTVANVTYDGVGLVPAGGISMGTGIRVELWYLTNPATGNNQVQVSLNGGNTAAVAGSVSLTGVSQSNPIENSAFATGNGTTASVNVNTLSNNAWVLDTLGKVHRDDADVGTGQTERWNRMAGTSVDASRIRGAGSTRGPVTPAGAVTMSWTLENIRDWAVGAVAVRPAAAGQVVTWSEVVQ